MLLFLLRYSPYVMTPPSEMGQAEDIGSSRVQHTIPSAATSYGDYDRNLTLVTNRKLMVRQSQVEPSPDASAHATTAERESSTCRTAVYGVDVGVGVLAPVVAVAVAGAVVAVAVAVAVGCSAE
jgi:hypothetical protein